MKHYILPYIIILFCSIITTSCNHNSHEGFSINFKFENVPDCNIYVTENTPDTKNFFADTIVFNNGKAIYKGSVKYPQMTNFSFFKGEDKFLGNISLLLDNENNIEITGKSIKEAIIKNSPCHEKFIAITKDIENYTNKLNEINNKRKSLENDSLQNIYERTKDSLLYHFIKQPDYTKNNVYPYFIYSNFLNETDRLEKALKPFENVATTNGYIKEAQKELSRQKRSAIGEQAYDFILNDIYGKQYKLSDYKGKYILLEFSASWCGWCKKEIPFLKQIYDKQKNNQEFAILTINLDEKKETWENDVKKDNLPWPVISDLKAFKSEVAQAFNIHGIPMIYLIDKNGRIIDKGLRGEKMIEKIETLFK